MKRILFEAALWGAALGTVAAVLQGCAVEVIGEPEVDVVTQELGGLPTLHGNWCPSTRRCVNIPIYSQGGSEWFGEGDPMFRPLNLGRIAVTMYSAGAGEQYCHLDDDPSDLPCASGGWCATCDSNNWVLRYCGRDRSRFDGQEGCRIYWPGGGWSEGYWFGNGRETYVIKRCGAGQPTFRVVDDETINVCYGG